VSYRHCSAVARRAALWVALLGFAAVAAPACADGGPPAPSPAATGAAVADKALRRVVSAGTVHGRFHAYRTPGLNRLTCSGTFQWAKDGSLRVHVERGNGVQGDVYESPTDAEIVRVGDTAYVRSPATRGRPGRPWARVQSPPGRGGDRDRTVTPLDWQIPMFWLLDPSLVLESGVGTQLRLSDEPGTDPSHRAYTANWYFDSQRPSPELGGWLTLVGNPTYLNLVLVVDRTGLPVELKVNSFDDDGEMDLQARFDSYGLPARIVAPPAGQVAG
jgi:hypothetical protein